jgi:hypothetical protein
MSTPMRARHVFSWCILAGIAAASGPASADDAMTDAARDLFMKGARAAEQQRWDQCRAVMLAALAIKPHPQVAGNLAGCELKLKLYRDAAEHLAYSLRELRPDAPPERRVNTEAALHEAQAKIETIRLTVNVRGAEVRVDGRVAGRAPLLDPLFVEPGPHTIEALEEGFPAARATVEATAGGTRDLSLELKKPEVPPPPPPPTEHRWRPGPVPLVIGGALAVAGLGAGTGLAVAASGKRANAEGLRTSLGGAPTVCTNSTTPSCTALLSDLRSRDALSNAAVGSIVAGGALAAATIGLAVWDRITPRDEKSAAPSFRIAPMLGGDGRGVTLRATW